MLTLTEVKEVIKDIDRRGLENLLKTYDDAEEIISAALRLGISPSDIKESYQGKFRDDEEFAETTAGELGLIDNNARWPQTCIDWKHAAKELMYDYSEENGYYFRNI